MKKESFILLLISIAVAIIAWAVNPNRLPIAADETLYKLDVKYEVVDAQTAVSMYNNDLIILIDVRSSVIDKKIPGAFYLRQDSFDDDYLELFEYITPEEKLLLLGTGDLMVINAIADRLAEKGYSNLVLLGGDIKAWQNAGGEVK